MSEERTEIEHRPAAPESVAEAGPDVAVSARSAYWRSLEELAGSPEFQKWVEDEFPERSSLLTMDRRRFLQVMGASMALAGLTGCRYLPQRKAVPFVRAVEDQVPGKPLFYASSILLSGIASPVLVESHEGRPTKIEGNPSHPASLGSTDLFTQAAVLGMYDPDRSQNVTFNGQIATWDELTAATVQVLEKAKATGGAGLRILSGALTGPATLYLRDRLLAAFPRARWVHWEPVHTDDVRQGMLQAFGRPVQPRYHFDRADVVLSLDADFLTGMPGSVRYARDFMGRRKVRSDRRDMNRLYVVECTPSNTGAVADHRLPTRAQDVHRTAVRLARLLGLPVEETPPATGMGARPLGVAGDDYRFRWLEACARDLLAHRGKCLIVAGDHQPPEVHVLVAAMNEVLGNVGSTIEYTEPIIPDWPAMSEGIGALAEELRTGAVRALLVLDSNPVYTAPAGLDLEKRIRQVPFSLHLGLYQDETARACRWHCPMAHDLEAWGDARSFDGTVTFRQPLIEPLFGGKTVEELLSVMLGRPADGYELLRSFWSKRLGGAAGFRRAVHDGFVAESALPAVSATVRREAVVEAGRVRPFAPPAPRDTVELVFRPDPTVYDGRFANNGWLQELPKAMTRLTWDNAALMSPDTARRLGLKEGSLVELRVRDSRVTAPVRLQPGHARGSVTVHLGGGRTRAGTVGDGVGFSAYGIRPLDSQWIVPDAYVVRQLGSYRFAVTEDHHALDTGRLSGQQGRDIVRVFKLDEFDRHKSGKHSDKAEHGHKGFYEGEDHQYDGYAWGMVIDLSVCTGCNAYVVACQAENNIPVVGRDQVARGREMHWIRIDRYYEGDAEDPAVHHQPVMCMHCELAPCEPVCPVAATVHSHEGLNQMVYNRCVGTRYCSNNCPYKVRRFNFLNYANKPEPRLLQMLRNPNVTVRGRGVMEKCTFCVQRINAARIAAKKENREIRDGEIVTACQAACPTKAIVFGSIADPSSEVARLKHEPHGYALLEELNTRPRLTYLAKVINPNPEMPVRSGEPARSEGSAS